MPLTSGRSVIYWDEDGEPHEAVAIDVFERQGDTFGPYVNLVFNPGQEEFGANTLTGLEDDTSVPHRIDAGCTERTYTTVTEVF